MYAYGLTNLPNLQDNELLVLARGFTRLNEAILESAIKNGREVKGAENPGSGIKSVSITSSRKYCNEYVMKTTLFKN